MGHLRIKPTKRIAINFDVNKITEGVKVPQESKDFTKDYLSSTKLADEYGMDITIMFDNEMNYAFDYINNEKKVIMPEINPITIFYANALMSQKMLHQYKSKLLAKAVEVNSLADSEAIHPSDFSDFFQFSIIVVINLQASLETFLNYCIPENHVMFSNNDKEIKRPNIYDKIDYGITSIKKLNFEDSFDDQMILIKDLIQLRNDVIHLKPVTEETKTKYKNLFRRLIDFKFDECLLAVKNYINFYEANLIEECPCGINYYISIQS
jgi:hypothetical protein